MSQANSPEQQFNPQARLAAGAPTQKHKLDAYTLMLAVALLCLIVASVLLHLELGQWGEYPWWDTSGAKPNLFSYQIEPPAWLDRWTV